MINSNNDRLTRVQNLVEENARAISSLIQVVTIHQQNIDTIIIEIRDMKSEIRGLQLENRRLIEELRGRRNDEET